MKLLTLFYPFFARMARETYFDPVLLLKILRNLLYKAKSNKHDEGSALVLLLGCKVHPRPRHRRILRNLFIKQHSAAATMTQRTVSGQASFAGRAVRKAHSEKPRDQLKTK